MAPARKSAQIISRQYPRDLSVPSIRPAFCTRSRCATSPDSSTAGIHLPRRQPSSDRSRDELRPVIRANRSRCSTLRFQPRQNHHHVARRHPPFHFQRQTLPRELVHHRKPLQPSSLRSLVHREIPTPHVILVLRLFHRATILAVAAGSFSPLPKRVPQPFLSPQSLHPLLVDLHPCSPQQPGHPPVA